MAKTVGLKKKELKEVAERKASRRKKAVGEKEEFPFSEALTEKSHGNDVEQVQE